MQVGKIHQQYDIKWMCYINSIFDISIFQFGSKQFSFGWVICVSCCTMKIIMNKCKYRKAQILSANFLKLNNSLRHNKAFALSYTITYIVRNKHWFARLRWFVQKWVTLAATLGCLINKVWEYFLSKGRCNMNNN